MRTQRDLNDAVPILVLVIDLQRSMEAHKEEYRNEPNLVAVFLRLQLSESDPLRFAMLMQVSSRSLL